VLQVLRVILASRVILDLGLQEPQGLLDHKDHKVLQVPRGILDLAQQVQLEPLVLKDLKGILELKETLEVEPQDQQE
jgi:hypothetical protein